MDMNKTGDSGHYDLLTESPMHSNGSNSSHGVHQTTHIVDMPESFAVPIVFGIIFVVGVVGNGTLIYTVLRNKSMRNVPNIFIVSLSLGDLLLILVSVPFHGYDIHVLRVAVRRRRVQIQPVSTDSLVGESLCSR